MLRRFWNGKRMLAAALAVSLVLGEPSAVYASGMYPEGGEDADSVQVEEIVSVNDAQTIEEAPDVQSAEDVQDNDLITPQNAASGALSQVIGVKGTHSIDDKGVCRVTFTWNSLTIPRPMYDAAGNQLWLGYEVRINGKADNSATEMSEANGTKHSVISDDECSYIYEGNCAVGSSVTAEVRGVYYYAAQGGGYRISSFGPWSEPETYVVKQKTEVPAVTGVAAQVVQAKSKTIRVSWNPVPQTSYYTVFFIDTDKDLNLTPEDFFSLWNKDTQTAAKEKYGIGDGFFYSDFDNNYNYAASMDLDWNKINTSSDHKGKYHYFVVRPIGVADEALYEKNKSAGTTVVKVVTTWDEEENNYTYAPAVQNFKAEKMSYGEIALTWTPQNRQVLIYVYDSPQFPDWFHYRELGAYRSGGSLTYDLDSQQRAKLNKVRCIRVNPTSEAGKNGRLVANSEIRLVPDRTYYFVAYTYAGAGNIEKTPITYTTKDSSGKTVTYSYTRYCTFSAPSATVSASWKMGEPAVNVSASKDSLKLTMGSGNGYLPRSVTGYEIYRKSGKKYKRIATITSDTYTDTDLKANTKYSYKVRSYYYDTDSKTKYYGQYGVVDARTGTIGNIRLTAVEKSQTSVKLNWTKVAGAVKYEIYRTYSTQYDPKNISKEYSTSNTAGAISNSRYELVKTINKQKTTTYTDKKLTAGESYSYKVIAYVKNGAQTESIESSKSITLKLRMPYNVKTKVSGSAVKVTWGVDKYASKYELEYTVYDRNGKEKTDFPVKASTKKNAYTIKNIGLGEYVSIRVRAYGKNKTYSDWTSVTSEERSLPQVKNVKAINVKEKLPSGKTVDAVKITWKPVSGAKYYKVYRSTTEGCYDEDKKLWQKSPNAKLIAAESNDNWTDAYNNTTYIGSYDDGVKTDYEVYYNQYCAVQGSVTGTSAVDYSSDLKKGVTYYYTVIACGDIIAGGAYAATFVESAGCSKAAAVTYASDIKVKTKSAGKGKVKLTYNKVSGAKKYVIYRAQKKNGKYAVIGSTKKTSYTDKKTKKGKTYYYKIMAKGTNALKADLQTTSAPKKIKVKK